MLGNMLMKNIGSYLFMCIFLVSIVFARDASVPFVPNFNIGGGNINETNYINVTTFNGTLTGYATTNSSNQPFTDTSGNTSLNTNSRIMYNANGNWVCNYGGLAYPNALQCQNLYQGINVVCDDSGNCINSYLKLNQSNPQTIIEGIPLLASNRNISGDYQLVDKKYVDDNILMLPSGGMKSFFFTKNDSDIGGMYRAVTTNPQEAKQTITATANDGQTLLATFITDIINTSYRVTDGNRFFYFDAKVSNIAKVTQLRGEIYTANLSGGNQTLLRNSTLTIPLTLVEAEYSNSVYGNSIVIPNTTRIIFKIYSVKEAGGVLPTVTLEVNDDTLSRLDVPSPVGVTDIGGLLKIDQTVPQTTTGTFHFTNITQNGSQVCSANNNCGYALNTTGGNFYCENTTAMVIGAYHVC